MEFYIQKPLSYSYDALEPFIDARTMELHYTKHHAGYLSNFNRALKEWEGFEAKPIEDLLSDLNSIPEKIRQSVINNGGGFYNHALFWEMMTPDDEKRHLKDGPLLSLINDAYGDLEGFKKIFSEKAMSLFGSGWVWLVQKTDGSLDIRLNSFQNNPLMKNPSLNILLGLDVWEHAYYLKYQNRRAEYIENWWNVVNWEFVESQLNLN